ncbi:MAG: ABC transporter substrate-binding protein [Bacillota bacterium]
MRKKTSVIILMLIVGIISLVLVYQYNGYNSDESGIKVGVLLNLSGPSSELGIDIRDGSLMAAEKINESGGIMGEKIDLQVVDYRLDPEIARGALVDFKEAGVEVVIGPALSEIIGRTLNTANELDLLILSPISGSSQLQTEDNNLVRMVPASEQEQKCIVEHIMTNTPAGKTALIYDRSNYAFASDWRIQLANLLFKQGGRVVDLISLDFSEDQDYQQVISRLGSTHEALVIVANPIDTAILLQHYDLRFRKSGEKKKPVYGTRWSFDQILFQYGAGAVDDLIIPLPWKQELESELSHEFNQSFKDTYNHSPDFGSYYGYEALFLLKDVLARNIPYQSQEIKEEILKGDRFFGLSGDISFNRYGDAVRNIYLYQAQEGEFRRVEPR